MRNILTKISSAAFGIAFLGWIILRPELFAVWGVRIGVGSLLAALGWEVASSIKGR